MDLCFTEEGCSNSIVLEKQVFRSKMLESHVQLACSLHYCAFPLNGNELCVWDTTDDPDYQVKNLGFFCECIVKDCNLLFTASLQIFLKLIEMMVARLNLLAKNMTLLMSGRESKDQCFTGTL